MANGPGNTFGRILPTENSRGPFGRGLVGRAYRSLEWEALLHFGVPPVAISQRATSPPRLQDTQESISFLFCEYHQKSGSAYTTLLALLGVRTRTPIMQNPEI